MFHYVFFPTGSDLHNGIMGFSLSSQFGHILDEDSENRTAVLLLERQENRYCLSHRHLNPNHSNPDNPNTMPFLIQLKFKLIAYNQSHSEA